ncbi:MAG: PDZ domain-containing protein [Bdellovibrionaceae bacterium]|nr:PDZ domain-containing protein [Pseudobdellovibrionaceae bacterium]
MERRWKLLTLLSFTVLAIGVSLWLGRVWLSGPEKASVATKSVDDYWAETGLSPDSLRDVVDDDTCQSSRRYFLACANALVTVAGRMGYEISLQGELKPLSEKSNDQTEITQLETWKKSYSENPQALKVVRFGSLWKQLMEMPIQQGKRATLTGAGLNAFLSVFRDPHTYILPLDYYQNVISNPQASSTVLGVVLARSEQGYFLRKVIEGSPAASSGLQRGDWVLSVNEVVLKDYPPQRLGDLLRGAEGKSTEIEVLRGGKNLKISVQRSNVKIPSVAWKPLEGDRPVGVLTLHKFAQGSCMDMKKALTEMNGKKLQGLLLDLRDNSGGQMDEAACMVSLFVGPDKAAFRIRYLDPSRDPETHFGSEAQLWNGRIAVLVNSGTASAAEILAGSLRDHKRALLVGERTFGKGSFQEGEIWKRNGRIAFFQTKGFYYLPSGYSPQLKGVAPDVKVSFRKSLALREEDQYLNPLLSPSRVEEPPTRTVDLSICASSAGVTDDPQLNQAQTALFCEPVAGGGPRAAL